MECQPKVFQSKKLLLVEECLSLQRRNLADSSFSHSKCALSRRRSRIGEILATEARYYDSGVVVVFNGYIIESKKARYLVNLKFTILFDVAHATYLFLPKIFFSQRAERTLVE